MFTLTFHSGLLKGQTVTLRKPEVLVGRDSECDIILVDDDVSRRHAVLQDVEGQVRLCDLGALNPPTVNGVPVDNAWIESGDLLGFGSVSATFRVLEAPAPVRAPRRSRLELLAMVLTGLVFAAQAFFLLRSSVWRSHIDRAAFIPTPTPIPSPTPLPTPDSGEDPVPLPTETPVPQQTPTPEPPPTPEPSPTPGPLPTPTPVPGTEALTPQQLLERAKALGERDNLLEADRLLGQLLHQAPEVVEAHAERAVLFGKRAMYKESIAQWEAVLAHAQASESLKSTAREQLQIMKRRQRLLEGDMSVFMQPGAGRPSTPTPPPLLPTPLPTPVPRPTPAAIPRVEFGRVNVERYSESPHFSEMRMLHYTIRHRSGQPAATGSLVRSHVSFYEREIGGDRVFPATVEGAVVEHTLKGTLQDGGEVDLTAPYIVPRAAGARQREFYGLRIALYYGGELQAVHVWPEALRNQLGP